jgi:hypothetical protein
VATLNGASFLHKHEIGTIDRGRQADLVIVRGNPASRIADVRNVEMVVKEGVGYDPAMLVNAAAGSIGAYDLKLLLRWPANAIVALLLLLLAVQINKMGGRRAARKYYRNVWSVEGLNSSSRKAS